MECLKTPSSSKSECAPRTRKQHKSRGNRSVDSSSSIASGRLTSLINIEENMASFALSPVPSRLSVLSDNTDIQEPRRRSWWRKLEENSREIMDVFESNKNVEPNNFLEELDIEVLSQEQKNYNIDLPDSSESESIASIVMPQRRLFTQKENQPPKNLNALIDSRKSIDKQDRSKIIADDVTNVNKNKLFQSKTRSKPILSVAILNVKSNKTSDVTKESELPNGQVRNIFGHHDGGKRKDICTKFVGNGNDDLSINKTLIDNSEKRTTKKNPVRNIFGNHSGIKRKNMFADFIGSESGSMSANETFVSKSKESEEMRNKVRNIFENATGVTRRNIFTEFVTIENEVLDKSQSRELREPSPTSSCTTDIEIDDWKQLPSSTMMEHQLIDTIETSAKKSKLSQVKADSSNANTIVNKTRRSNKSILLQNTSKSSPDSVRDITQKIDMSVSQGIKNKSKKSIQNEHIPKIIVNDESLNMIAPKNNSVSNSGTKNSNITVINNSTRVQNNSKRSSTTITQENNAKKQNNLHESSSKPFYENTAESTVSNLLKSKANEENNENHQVNKVDNNKTNPNEQQIDNHIMEGDEEIQNESENTADNEMDYQQSESDQEVTKDSTKNDDTNEQMEQSIQNESETGDNENDQSVVDSNGDKNDETDGNESAVNKTDDENESAIDDNDIENESAVNENDDENESAVDANESVVSARESIVDPNESAVMEKDHKIESVFDANESAVNENDEENESVADANDSTVNENDDENESAVDPNEESAIDENDEENEGINNENESAIDENDVENERSVDENDVENEISVDENDIENESASDENDDENEGVGYENDEYERAVNENETTTDFNHITHKSAVNDIDDGNEIAIEDNNEEDESTNEIPNENEINIPDSDNDENSESNIKRENPTARTALQSSPEAILRLNSNHDVSYATQRSTLQATKYSIKDLNIKTSLMPLRESTRMSDGIPNSSEEGSAWDSHRTTRKTLRQTFGRDFTIRKSLRAMVMEKSAKRQTAVNGLHANENSPKVNAMQSGDESSFNLEDNQNISNREDSRQMMQAELEMQQAELEMQKHVEELKKRMFKMGEAAKKYFNDVKKEPHDPFKVPSKPKFTTRETKVARKKVKKQYNYVIPKEMLPDEFLKDLKYKPPKRYQPKNVGWATKRLYRFLESKLEPHYAYRSRVRAERVVRDLYEFVMSVRKVQVAPPTAINGLKHELARLNIIRTHYDFFIFFHEYMPKELGFKVIPDLMNKLPLPRDLYGDILQDNR
ncbi:hypothetical protein K1T71_006303 [Dendrolimus kikuchii]|uniref:Uncharacterized protein n=1 Tax=Dendrolimus kikuchii TaxID=765133 RepID=A0ACC1D3T2_9NEOP|nr:hypothetical protein K1T71_006303 [Dendrolimus kikuchii]